MRLDDIYFNRAQLDGVPVPPGQPVPIQFYQGEDIVFEVYIKYNAEIVLPDSWNIRAIVKKNAFAEDVLWDGGIANGVYTTDVPGFYKLIIPSSTTGTFYAGTYWLNIVISQKVGKGDEKDITAVVLNQPFSVDYAAASPNPPSKLNTGGVEVTYPPAVDITKT